MKKTPVRLIAIILGCGNASWMSSIKEDYQLTIEKGEVRKVGKQQVWVVPATLTNHSQDTLHYWSMYCSWTDDYLTDQENVVIEPILCDKNFPIELQLAPHQSRTVPLKLLASSQQNNRKESFRVGFRLTPVKRGEGWTNYWNKRSRSKLIWSNPLSMN